MPSSSIKLEIDQESYDKTYGQIQALYELAQKASIAIEKAAQHSEHRTTIHVLAKKIAEKFYLETDIGNVEYWIPFAEYAIKEVEAAKQSVQADEVPKCTCKDDNHASWCPVGIWQDRQ